MDASFCKFIRIGIIVDLTRNIMYFRKDLELSATVSFLLYSSSILGIKKKLLGRVETTLQDIPIDQQGVFSTPFPTSIIYIYLFWLEITLKLGAPTAQPGVSLIITYDCNLSSAAAKVVSPAPDNFGESAVLDVISAALPSASHLDSFLESFEPVKKTLDRLASVSGHIHSVIVTT
jgi:hypothetical protein